MLILRLIFCCYNFFCPKKEGLKIGTFGMLNNPDYREEPWRENIAARLDFFDVVCLVCGHEPDVKMLAKEFPLDWQSGKLKAIYKPWPFPEWSYEELPKHLNTALRLVREQGCAWAVKLDVDTVFHEKDKNYFNFLIKRAHKKGKWLVSFGKYQFFLPTRYWIKGNLPLAVNLSTSLVYGFDETKYTDLCQPINWDGFKKVVLNGKTYDIPSGRAIPQNKILKTRGLNVFNYDYTFRTYERSIELLYQIEMAHGRFWGKSYSGIPFDSITRETAMDDFLHLSLARYSSMCRKMKIEDHPKFFQKSLQNLKPEHWGSRLWGKITLK